MVMHRSHPHSIRWRMWICSFALCRRPCCPAAESLARLRKLNFLPLLLSSLLTPLFLSFMCIANISNSHKTIDFGKMRVTYPLFKINLYTGKLRPKEIKKFSWVTNWITGWLNFISAFFLLFYWQLKISGHLKNYSFSVAQSTFDFEISFCSPGLTVFSPPMGHTAPVCLCCLV